MKTYTIYNGIENFTKKEIIRARAEEKRSVTAELANFANSIEYAYKQLTAVGSQARNAANAAKGTYKTALEVIVSCYPFQDKLGNLYIKSKGEFKQRKLQGRAAAGAVVAAAVKNFIDYKTGRIAELITYIDE